MEYLRIIFSIILVDFLLSGDNALVIALACRHLTEEQRKKAIFWGCAGAITLRVILTIFAVILLKIPYVHLVGGFMLVWIAIKIVVTGPGRNQSNEEDIKPANGLYEAVKTIIIADFVMSLDNVIALAGVSRGNVVMLICGLLISIPLIIWGSKVILWLIHKFSVIVMLGGAFLGYTGGEMIVSDPGLQFWVELYPWFEYVVPFSFAVIVLVGSRIFTAKTVEK